MSPNRFLRTSTLAPAMALSASLLVLSACGGGGGGGDSAVAAPTAAVASQLVVTEANQQTVAAESVEVAQQGVAVTDLGTSLATGAQVSGGASAPGLATLSGVARKLIAMAPHVPALATGVTESDTESCSGGGSVSLTATTSATSGVVTGDSITASANNCVETIDGVTRRLDGQLSLSVSAGSFDPASSTFPKDVTLHMTAANLSLDNIAMNGTLDLHLVQTNGIAGSVAVSTPQFTWKATGASSARTLTLKNYTQRVDQTTVDAVSITVTGTVESDNAHYGTGTVSYDISTPQPVVVNTLVGGTLVGGGLKVTGKDSALLITVTGNNTLQLQVDTNGDGTYDSTQSVSRFALVP